MGCLRRWDTLERTHGSGVRAEEVQEPRTLEILDVQNPFIKHTVLLCSRPKLSLHEFCVDWDAQDSDFMFRWRSWGHTLAFGSVRSATVC